MNQIARIDHGNVTRLDWSQRQLATIKQTVAKETNESEFNLFIEYCRVKQLDPFSRQAIALIFNKDDQKKRQMTIVTTQDGLRVIASRCGDYRPSETEPEYTYDEKLKSPTNPLGIVKCSITLWKQDHKSDKWHPVNGVAYWDEFVPVKIDSRAYEWVPTGEVYEDSGRAVKRKQIKEGIDLANFQTIEENWRKMGRVMIAKCATSQALRAGWPETFSGVYGEEEMDRARVADLTASEMVAMEQEERRAKAISMSKDEYFLVDHTGTLHFYPAASYGDEVIKMMKTCADKAAFDSARLRNKEALQRFWAKHKSDALQVNAELEKMYGALVM